MSVAKILIELSIYSIFVPFGMILLLNKRISREMIPIVAYVLFLLIMDQLAVVFASGNNLWLFHIYTYVEYVLFLWYFFQLTKSLRVRWFMLGVSLCFYIFSFYWLSYKEGLLQYNGMQRGVENIIFILLIFIYFGNLFIQGEIEDLRKHGHFLLSAMLLMYFSGTLFGFLLSNYEIESGGLSFYLDNVHNVSNVCLNGTITFVLWQQRRKKT